MITRQRVTVAFGLLLFTASGALADPFLIRITHGELAGPASDAALRVRQQGLAIDASGDSLGGIWGISECRTGCSPGVPLSFDAIFSGSDFEGVVTVGKRTFPVGLGTATEGSLLVEFRASTMLPAFTGRPLISIRTPFSFDGQLSTPYDTADLNTVYALSGTGRATLEFEWSPSYSAWLGDRARYDFVAAPEPSTLPMTGVALAGLSLARRFRRTATRTGRSRGRLVRAVGRLRCVGIMSLSWPS